MAGQGGAALLDRLDPGGAVAGGGGGELDLGHGGRLQHGQVGRVQPLQLQLEQAAEVVRDLLAVAAGAARQLPAPAGRPQDAGVGPGLGELHHEQRHPVGAPVHQPGSSSGTSAPGRSRPSTVATAATPSSPSRSSVARPRSRSSAPASPIGAPPARASAGR